MELAALFFQILSRLNQIEPILIFTLFLCFGTLDISLCPSFRQALLCSPRHQVKDQVKDEQKYKDRADTNVIFLRTNSNARS